MLKIKNVLNVALCLVLSLLGTSLIFSFVLSMDKVTYQHAFPTAYFLICWVALLRFGLNKKQSGAYNALSF